MDSLFFFTVLNSRTRETWLVFLAFEINVACDTCSKFNPTVMPFVYTYVPYKMSFTNLQQHRWDTSAFLMHGATVCRYVLCIIGYHIDFVGVPTNDVWSIGNAPVSDNDMPYLIMFQWNLGPILIEDHLSWYRDFHYKNELVIRLSSFLWPQFTSIFFLLPFYFLLFAVNSVSSYSQSDSSPRYIEGCVCHKGEWKLLMAYLFNNHLEINISSKEFQCKWMLNVSEISIQYLKLYVHDTYSYKC